MPIEDHDQRDETGGAKDGWLKNAAVALGALGTFLGAVGTIWAATNSHTLSTLQFQYQSDREFAHGIHAVAETIAKHDADPKNESRKNDDIALRAMVEYSSLYAAAESMQQKLILIEMAQVAHQNAAMLSLSGLVRADHNVQHPAPSEIEAATAIKTAIDTSANLTIAAESTPAPASRPATVKTPAPRGPHQHHRHGTLVPVVVANAALPADDPALTESSNPSVRANAALIAALPAGQVSGWAFVGDASDAKRQQLIADLKAHKAAVLSLDAQTDVISSPNVPSAGSLVTACQDLNVRVKPFQGGTLGAVVGIASRGSLLRVDPNDPIALETISRFPPHRAIAAIWLHLTLQPQESPGRHASGAC